MKHGECDGAAQQPTDCGKSDSRLMADQCQTMLLRDNQAESERSWHSERVAQDEQHGAERMHVDSVQGCRLQHSPCIGVVDDDVGRCLDAVTHQRSDVAVGQLECRQIAVPMDPGSLVEHQ